MSAKLLWLSLLLAVFCHSLAKKQACLKSASNCEECLQSGPECAWCTESHSNIRCHTSTGLRRAGCRDSAIYNPQGRVEVVKNVSSTESSNAQALFLQPQELSLRLRPGVSQSFALSISMPTDQPITELNIDTTAIPTGVNITISTVVNGSPKVMQVDVEADQCPGEGDTSNQRQNLTGPWSVFITPRGFSIGLKLEITLECRCACSNHQEQNSPACAGHGTLVCGQCECNEPYIGRHCQKDSSEDDLCRPGPDATLCSGRGKCVKGVCECVKRVDPEEKHYGKFCECSNFANADCPFHRGLICGGHGRCECGKCLCDDDWTGEDCSCTMDTASCMAKNQKLCNDRGTCVCGTCRCTDPKYMGPTCEVCPQCPGRCAQHEGCAECLAFRSGPKKESCAQDCSYLNVTVMKMTDSSIDPEDYHCRSVREDYCYFFWTIPRMPDNVERAVVWDPDCPPALFLPFRK